MVASYLLKKYDASVEQSVSIVKMSRSSWYYKGKLDDSKIVEKLGEMVEKYPTRGFENYYHRIRREGHTWAWCRILRVYRELGLVRRAKKRYYLPDAQRKPLQQPECHNETWSMDFMSDAMMDGRSFREFLQIEEGIKLEHYTLKDVIAHHQDITHSILNKGIKPLKYFKNYLNYGYYPFYLENQSAYPIKLLNLINLTLEIDLVSIKNVDPVSIPKLKKLINLLASSVPFQPNISKLAGSIEITRNTLLQYLQYLAQAKILNLLQDSGSNYSYIAKPEKVLLHNPNLMSCLQPNSVNLGSMRETFFVNAISALYQINTTSQGDFVVEDKYRFEVGGANKTNKQIAGLEDSYLVVDDIEIGSRNKIPLWLFGFFG